MLAMQLMGAVRKEYTKMVPKLNVMHMLQKLGQKKLKETELVGVTEPIVLEIDQKHRVMW